jgi:hypothetical protein
MSRHKLYVNGLSWHTISWHCPFKQFTKNFVALLILYISVYINSLHIGDRWEADSNTTRRCCYMAFNLQCFNAIFFQPYLFQRYIFQWILRLDCRYFQRAYIWTTIIVHERGKHASRYYNIICMPSMPLPFLLSNSVPVYHMLARKKILLFIMLTFTLISL